MESEDLKIEARKLIDNLDFFVKNCIEHSNDEDYYIEYRNEVLNTVQDTIAFKTSLMKLITWSK